MVSERDRARAEAFGRKLQAFASELTPAEQTWLLSICAAACAMLDPDTVAGYGMGPFGPHRPVAAGISVQQLANLFASADPI